MKLRWPCSRVWEKMKSVGLIRGSRPPDAGKSPAGSVGTHEESISPVVDPFDFEAGKGNPYPLTFMA